jgi:competence protein ComFB
MLKYQVPGTPGKERSMAFKDDYEFKDLENETEKYVIQFLGEELEGQSGLCTCEDCVLDMATFALNQSPPAYRVSLLGKLYAQAKERDQAYMAHVKKAVQTAVKRIKENPSHS